MPKSPKPTDLKKQLIAEGFEVFRVDGSTIHLAERVRENLIMDSGVAAVAGPKQLLVRFVTRAQASQFPGEEAEELFQRARHLGERGVTAGYEEVETTAVPVRDPGGGTETLDTWYEVAFEKNVTAESLVNELRYALGLEKASVPS